MRDLSDLIESQAWQKVVELVRERPDWVPVLEAACEEAEAVEPYGGRFAGRWVLQRLKSHTKQLEWRPGLRLLAGYGFITKSGESTRGGRRAYYQMPAWREVKEALTRLKEETEP